MATTNEGCKSQDTLLVLQVYPLPVVQLSKESAICFGDTRVLDAGAFEAYRWQDGSISRTYTVSGAGRWYVEVTDNYGCKGSDTTTIRTVYPLPTDFLPADTTLCSYEKLTLQPSASFRNYLWSTSNRSSMITVEQPGRYWLQVQDARGCSGRDSVTVAPKDCMSGFYIPTAFSPNGDGKNDVYRPLLFGRVKHYRFAIYNRWGEAVFTTTEQHKGWDGKLAGAMQRNNVFVWTCTYQFEGETVKQQKGTLTVIL
jgi:gliding motility-associated-like protein